MSSPAALAPLLEALLQREGLSTRLQAYRVWPLWNRAVGPQIARQAQPLRFRDGLLEVRVNHPVWMQQLQLMKPQLIRQLNQLLGQDLVRDLYLRRGRIEADGGESPPHRGPQPWQQIRLTDVDRQDIDATAGAAADPEVRALLQRLLQRQRQLDRYRRQAGTPS